MKDIITGVSHAMLWLNKDINECESAHTKKLFKRSKWIFNELYLDQTNEYS